MVEANARLDIFWLHGVGALIDGVETRVEIAGNLPSRSFGMNQWMAKIALGFNVQGARDVVGMCTCGIRSLVGNVTA